MCISWYIKDCDPSLRIPHSTPCLSLSPPPSLFILIIFLIPLLIHLLFPLLFLFHLISFSSSTPRSSFPSPYCPPSHPPLYFSSCSPVFYSHHSSLLLLPFSCFSLPLPPPNAHVHSVPETSIHKTFVLNNIF